MFGSDRETPALRIRNERAFGRGSGVRATNSKISTKERSSTLLRYASFRAPLCGSRDLSRVEMNATNRHP
jgi:hypothetical protein